KHLRHRQEPDCFAGPAGGGYEIAVDAVEPESTAGWGSPVAACARPDTCRTARTMAANPSRSSVSSSCAAVGCDGSALARLAAIMPSDRWAADPGDSPSGISVRYWRICFRLRGASLYSRPAMERLTVAMLLGEQEVEDIPGGIGAR